ncbi:methyl-CpG-binding domain protein 1b isoform X2 [Centropristis striata]|uniref:methyl-CpG-binding domain protein 1b isoform X2 n=1 Tax=Centropristis striata TaxID=184440 RepID=UPI0027DEE6CA|nr:methyl-CpG-binding domain protein 1b isoform X2 [Centropristis striata]
MNEEIPDTPVPGREPVEEDVGQSTEKTSSEVENTSEAAPAQEPSAPSDTLKTKETPSSEPAKETPSSDPVKETPRSETVNETAVEVKEEAKATEEPPMDWFEPLEDDDDALSIEESLAGESERSESVAGNESTHRKIYHLKVPRRKRSHPDEGWDEWPILGEGWKRKEVVRRSGSSIGQKDVYYLSPRGERVRSRVELASVLEGVLDLSNFEYKSGKFFDGVAPPIKPRNRAKKKVRERSSSESSWMERGEGADTPDSHHRLTPNLASKNHHSYHKNVSLQSTMVTPNESSLTEYPPAEDKIKLPPPSSSRANPLPSINGEIGSEDNTLVCARCGISFTGTWYDKQRKRPCCPTCWAASKTKEHPMIRFRKWIPCGQCVGCHNTINCGQCANCKHGLQSPESRKRICRKRKCICPIRKGPGGGALMSPQSYNDIPETFDDSMSYQNEVTESQPLSFKSSDTENFSVNVDLEDDDEMSTDDDDDEKSKAKQGKPRASGQSEMQKRKRRSCGECKACLCRKDCGTCDFCIDKPKFGGSNKKRQKCRLRQCQRQAMMAQSEFGPESSMLPGRPRPHYTYSRKSGLKKNKSLQLGLDFTDNEDDDSNLQAMNWNPDPASLSKHAYELNVRNSQSMQMNHLDFVQQNGLPDRVPYISNHNNSELEQLSRWDADRSHVGIARHKHAEQDDELEAADDDDDDDDEVDDDEDEDELPMITQIFSLADNPSGSGVDMENQLMKLLHSLRSSVLPILWYAIMVEGPQLQLIQCSKQSSLTDTTVLIDPGFCYQVTVQKQPLLPTHPLYDKYPARLTCVTEVVNLLLGLEQYVVCQGLPPKEPLLNSDPIILERASTCDFLVKRNVGICNNCRALQGL